MSRSLDISRADDDNTQVYVRIESPTERDMGVAHDAIDLLGWIGRVMGWRVTVSRPPFDQPKDTDATADVPQNSVEVARGE